MYTLYQHRRNDTNEIFYIGIGSYSSRPYNCSTRNADWKNIVNKHGRTVEILLTGLTKDDACEIEIKLIAQYGRKHMGGKLCNWAGGGEGATHIKKSTHDLTGKTFGQIYVTSYAHGGQNSHWNCVCGCNNEIIVSSANLKSGNTTCCKLCKTITSTFIDLTGETFGRLQVIENVTKAKNGQRTTWLCTCSCGKSKPIIVDAWNLKSGHTQSCGCYLKDQTTSHGLCAKDNLLYNKILYRLTAGKTETEIASQLGISLDVIHNIQESRAGRLNKKLSKQKV